ncbi:Mercuric ion transport protein, MerT precursor [Sphingopyxis sp. LC81]|jgi:mercuric ion transport protein|uniref:mercuric transporter MerT family protein n=1 Tax=Sphingopyxis sp. LC81 TaxID=1502850 RepID=UPI00050E287E|nr:mercuric transporter MerT family protein [Sphingopyxis sp. LC81]KGB54709.1 Mercuric ion transport protein, MerT precursor [Sphingopyxis sp. LC81]
MSQMQPRPKGIAAAALTATGIAAAFGVAACCALPILLASAGIGAAWLGGIAMIAVPYRTPLLLIAAACLLFGAFLLFRQQRAARRCGPGGACTPPVVRILTLAGLLLGAALLWAGYHYV